MTHRYPLCLMLACSLTGVFFQTAHAAVATTNVPAGSLPVFINVTKVEVDAFVSRWNAELKTKQILMVANDMVQSESNAVRLASRLLGALEREPQGAWVSFLKMVMMPQKDATLSSLEILGAWKQACDLLEKAVRAAPEDLAIQQSLEQARQSFISACLASGRNLDEAKNIAQGMLTGTPTNNWNYGNVVYEAHSVLGRIALNKGDRETARKELRAAGRTPGSPQLNSFGPQFVLARELLEMGSQEDRDAVIAFLDDVATFWANPDKETNPGYREMKKKNVKSIQSWKETIRAGKVPEDHFHWPRG